MCDYTDGHSTGVGEGGGGGGGARQYSIGGYSRNDTLGIVQFAVSCWNRKQEIFNHVH